MATKQPKGKLVRRFGSNIFGNPKYSKLLDRKPNAPGKERGAKQRGKLSVYGEQLKEKQNSALLTGCPNVNSVIYSKKRLRCRALPAIICFL